MTGLFDKIPDRAMTPEERKKLLRPPPAPRNTARPSPLPGPKGKTCKNCKNCRARDMRSGKRFYKCALVKPTGGQGTDIRLKDHACARFEPEEGK